MESKELIELTASDLGPKLAATLDEHDVKFIVIHKEADGFQAFVVRDGQKETVKSE